MAPPTTVVNSVIEEFAKFSAMKELIEDDLENEEPDESKVETIKSNQSEMKQFYLTTKVAQSKYKSGSLSDTITEEIFNSSEQTYKYNDTWISTVKKMYQDRNKAVSTFLNGVKTGTEEETEKKFSLTKQDELKTVLKKIKSESKHVTAVLDSSYLKLQALY